jgi:hypothetical protein
MKTNMTRRAVLVNGAKYAAIAPATTVLVAKSARAGGSSGPGPYTGPGGVQVTQASDCPILISAPGQVTHCLAHFAGF